MREVDKFLRDVDVVRQWPLAIDVFACSDWLRERLLRAAALS